MGAGAVLWVATIDSALHAVVAIDWGARLTDHIAGLDSIARVAIVALGVLRAWLSRGAAAERYRAERPWRAQPIARSMRACVRRFVARVDRTGNAVGAARDRRTGLAARAGRAVHGIADLLTVAVQPVRARCIV